MYDIDYYTTDSGNRPYDNFKSELAKEHKVRELAQIESYISLLKQYGLNISKAIGGKPILPIKDGIYELRPGGNRVLFFHYINGTFVILHAFQKTSNKTPKHEIDLALNEKKNYLKKHFKKQNK